MRIGWAVAGYILSCVLFRLYDNENRSALLRGATVWGAFAVLTSEGLSLIHQLSPRGLEVVWVAADLCLLVGILHRSMRPDFSFRPHWSPSPLAMSWIDAALLCCVSLIVIVVARTALLSPPNTWDVLTYHLPRIVHWLQHRNLAFYQ